MTNKTAKKSWFNKQLLLGAALCAAGITPLSPSHAQESVPSLIISSDSVPKEIMRKVYSHPSRIREIRPQELTGRSYYEAAQTIVTEKISGLEQNLSTLKRNIKTLSDDFDVLHSMNEGRSAEYFAATATINTQLQSGTTPGNPRLVERVRFAEMTLDNIAKGVSELNEIAVRAAQVQSESGFLADETRAAFRISGAVEEDHVRLSQLEDELEATGIVIDRILNNLSDDVTRLTAYLGAERTNVRTLALAVANGDMYGRSLGGRPFSRVSAYNPPSETNTAPTLASFTPDEVAGIAPPGPLPLVKIRFNKDQVNYEQPVYTAINDALARYPKAQFELIAIHPDRGNEAQTAVESTRARRNAEKVLRTVTQMGLPLERVNLSYNQSQEAATTEVHIYIR